MHKTLYLPPLPAIQGMDNYNYLQPYPSSYENVH
jgi:hypothetical protein